MVEFGSLFASSLESAERGLPSGYDLSSARNSTGQGKRKLKKTEVRGGNSGEPSFYRREKLAILTPLAACRSRLAARARPAPHGQHQTLDLFPPRLLLLLGLWFFLVIQFSLLVVYS